jgi:hypothetical protein
MLFPLHFVVFKQTTCHLSTEAYLDSDTLSDMVSNIVSKHAYKLSLHDLMDKRYEMFREKNHANKKDFFNSLSFLRLVEVGRYAH